MFELVIIWNDGNKEVYGGYCNYDDAMTAGDNMHMVFGDQIQWYGVRKH